MFWQLLHSSGCGGKSTALQAGLSFFGCDEIGMCVKASNSILLERACSSGMQQLSVWEYTRPQLLLITVNPTIYRYPYLLFPKSIVLGLPFAVEESKNLKSKSKTNNFDLGELIMDLSNGSRSANLRTGSIKPKTGFLAASNYTLDRTEERYMLL